MADPLHVIVLAAGEGKRMKSMLPKVLMPLAGRPMLAHVLDTARALRPEGLHVVYGHRGEQVRTTFARDTDIHWVHQSEQRGTGHAVKLALHDIADPKRILVLYGDVPLLRAETLTELVRTHAELAVLATELDDPSGYGRVLRDGLGRVRAIVEEKDADEAQREVRIVNTGVTFAESPQLRRWVDRLVPDNQQGELYLTDVFAQAADDGTPADVVMTRDPVEAFGANDAAQLAELATYLRRRDAHRLMLAGVRIADPARFDVTRANARDHLAFSGGIHYCLGAGLARLEGVVGLRALTERFPALRVAGRPVRRDLQTLRGYEHLPVALR